MQKSKNKKRYNDKLRFKVIALWNDIHDCLEIVVYNKSIKYYKKKIMKLSDFN